MFQNFILRRSGVVYKFLILSQIFNACGFSDLAKIHPLQVQSGKKISILNQISNVFRFSGFYQNSSLQVSA